MDYPSMKFDIVERVEAQLGRMLTSQEPLTNVLTDLVAIFANIDRKKDELRMQLVYCGDNPLRNTDPYRSFSLQIREKSSEDPAKRLERLARRLETLTKRLERLAKRTMDADGVMIVFSTLRLLDERYLGKSPLRYDLAHLYESLGAQELLANTQLHLAKRLFNMKFTGWDQTIADPSSDEWLPAAARIFELSLPALLQQNKNALDGLVAIVPDKNLWEYLYAGKCTFVYAGEPCHDASVETKSLGSKSLYQIDTSRQLCAAFDELEQLKFISSGGSGFVDLRKILRRSTYSGSVPQTLKALRTYCISQKKVRDPKDADKYQAIADALTVEMSLEKSPLNDLVASRVPYSYQSDEGNAHPYTLVKLLGEEFARDAQGTSDDEDGSEIVCSLECLRAFIPGRKEQSYVPLGNVLLKADQPDKLARIAYLATRERGKQAKDLGRRNASDAAQHCDITEGDLQDAALSCHTISLSNPWRWKNNDYLYCLNQYYQNFGQLLNYARTSTSLGMTASEYTRLHMWWRHSYPDPDDGHEQHDPVTRKPFDRSKLKEELDRFDWIEIRRDWDDKRNENGAPSIPPSDAADARAVSLGHLLYVIKLLLDKERNSDEVDGHLEMARNAWNRERNTRLEAFVRPGRILMSGKDGNKDFLMPSEVFLHELWTFIRLVDDSTKIRIQESDPSHQLVEIENAIGKLAEHIGIGDDELLPVLKQPDKPSLNALFGRLWIFYMPWHERLWIEAIYAQAISELVMLKNDFENPDKLHGKLRLLNERKILPEISVELELSFTDIHGNPHDVESAQILESNNNNYHIVRSPFRRQENSTNSFGCELQFHRLGRVAVDVRYARTRFSERQLGRISVEVAPRKANRQTRSAPFPTDQAIKDPRDFWGRRDILNEIAIGLAGSPRPLRYFHLFGSRRIGKSSMLQMIRAMLESPEARETLGVDKTLVNSELHCSAVEFDFSEYVQSLRAGTLNNELEKVANDALSNLEASATPNHYAVILVDGLETLNEATPQTRNKVLGTIKRLIDLPESTRLTWITASPQRDPLRMGSETSIILDELQRPEALDLIHARLSKMRASADPNATYQLLKESGGHPFVLQVICNTILPKNPGYISKFDVDEAIQEQLLDSGSLYNLCLSWWQKDTHNPAEQNVLRALAQYKDTANTGANKETLYDLYKEFVKGRTYAAFDAFFDALQATCESGIVKHYQSGPYRFAVPLFRRWIEEHRLLRR